MKLVEENKELKECKENNDLTIKDKVTRERERTKLDINYLKQRIKSLNDIEDLDTLVTELYVTAQLGKLVRDAHNRPF